MSSHDQHSNHLDAAGGRDVVYCHACSNEWYRDQGGLTCPSCHSDITEIINPEEDPREHMHHSSASTSPELHPRHFHDDSDPDEADIEDHFGPYGFQYNRSTRSGGPNQPHHNPDNEVVLEHFMRMIQQIAPQQGRSPGAGQTAGPFGEPRVHHTTIRTGPFGTRTATVTVFSGPAHMTTGGNGGFPVQPGADPFQAIFSNVIRDMGPQPMNEHQGGPPPGFAQGLHDILNLFWPGNARAGDAVYSQEALDRIITGLMEANPQSNAAPPASETALEKLDRRPVTKELLGEDAKTECSICIDSLEIGQMAAFLPCKHWFHDECVVAWLKEHNTCPICRTPIEKNEGTGNGRQNSAAGPAGNSQPQSPNRGTPYWEPSSPPPQPGPGPRPGHYDTAFRPAHTSYSQSSHSWSYNDPNHDVRPQMEPVPPARYPRPPSQSQSRINEAFRNISSMQARERDRATATGFSYDTSRLQRRDSTSPTSPRSVPLAEHGAQMRQRSPPQSGRRGNSDRNSSRRSQGGPISWIRDRFTGGGGSNTRDEDRF